MMAPGIDTRPRWSVRTLRTIVVISVMAGALVACSGQPAPETAVGLGSVTETAPTESAADPAPGSDPVDGSGAIGGPDDAPGVVAPEDMTIDDPEAPKNLCEAMLAFQMGQLTIDGTQESIDRVFAIVERFDAEMTDEVRDTIALMRAAYEKGIGEDTETRMEYLTTDEFVEAQASLVGAVLQTSCAATG